MPLMYNKSNCTQLLDSRSSIFPGEIHPGVVFDPSPYKTVLSEFFEEFHIEKIRNIPKLGIVRTYALGDVIQLIPVLRKIKKFYNIKEIILYTQERFVTSLSGLFDDIVKFQFVDYVGIDRNIIIINTNSLLEKDHSLTNSENNIHRVNIYEKFFNLPIDNIYDWSCINTVKKPDISREPNMKYIGLQIRGSGPLKTLPHDYIKSLAYKLSVDYKVVLIDYDRSQGFYGSNIIDTCGRLNVKQCIALLSQLDCCITMDSGVLWLAHSANCPVLTLLGPTREKERVSLHPLYPNKAKSISISKDLIGCEPCFETKVRCKGSVKCMNRFDRDKLTEMIQSKIKEIIGE